MRAEKELAGLKINKTIEAYLLKGETQNGNRQHKH